MTDSGGGNADFVAEAQELLDALNDQLMALEPYLVTGKRIPPTRVNNLFRAAHSLKGMARIFNADSIASLAHGLEGMLDGLRFGRMKLTATGLDVMFGATEFLGTVLGQLASGSATDADGERVQALLAGFERLLGSAEAGTGEADSASAGRQPGGEVMADGGAVTAGSATSVPAGATSSGAGPGEASGSGETTGAEPVPGSGEAEEVSQSGLDEAILSMLTAYELHRLRQSLSAKRRLAVVQRNFVLSTFEADLAALEGSLQAVGEVITKMPAGRDAPDDAMAFDLIVACDGAPETLATAAQIPVDDVKLVGPPAESVTEPVTEPATDSPAAATPRVEAESMRQSAAAPEPTAPAVSQPAAGGVGGAGLGESEAQASAKQTAQTVRVSIGSLDRLMNMVGELTLSRLALRRISESLRQLGTAACASGARTGLAGGGAGAGTSSRAAAGAEFKAVAGALDKAQRQLERRLSALQDGIMQVRMVPMVGLFDRMKRVGRKMTRELDRRVRVLVSGEHTELDKLLVEELADPLMHLLANAVDHGIERPADRIAAGKQPEGHVWLSAAAEGNHVVVEVRDDGAGLDTARILERAVEKGLVDAERAGELPREAIFRLLLSPGFSTRSQVSKFSGRGVGMDVVKNNISRLSGIIEIDSEPSKGTTFRIILPMTLAVIPALVARVGQQPFAVPLNNVLETMALDRSALQTVEGREVISVRGRMVPLVWLRDFFRLPSAPANEAGVADDRTDARTDARVSAPAQLHPGYAVVAGGGRHRVALAVDGLMGQQDIVLKSLGHHLRKVRGIAGATDLGHEQTVLVIDLADLLTELGMTDKHAVELSA